MCGVHHKVIDARENLSTYSVERLLKIKSDHESRSNRLTIPELTASAVEALLETVRPNYTSVTHMDFRGAQLSAGGQGGGLGGGGGAGGVINIVGVTPAGFREPVDANGKKGTSFGAGGGGGGVVVFSGRSASAEDLERGLRVTAFVMANSAEVQNSLFYAMGGGWEFLSLRSIPQQITIHFVSARGPRANATTLIWPS